MRGLNETLKFWEQGSKPLHFEGQVGSDLWYALREHEGYPPNPEHPRLHMLERDLMSIRKGKNPTTGKALRWGRKRWIAAIGDIEGKLKILHTPQPEGRPGRKYLTKVKNFHEKMYQDSAGDIIPHAIALLARNRESNLANAISVICEAFLRKLVTHFWSRSVAMAPLWHGDLRASLEAYVEGKLVASQGKAVELTKDRLMEKPPNVKKLTKEGLVLLESLENA